MITSVSRSNPDAAFKAGVDAFGLKARPLDNPYFGEAQSQYLFDAWSDGWHTAQDEVLPVRKRLAVRLKRASLRGVTATWAVHRDWAMA